MESNAPQSAPRYAHRPIQLVLARANGPFFYSLASASLIEASAPACAQRLLYVHGDKELCEWIQREWLPRKTARAAALQHYVEKTWPEFDWGAAREQYRAFADVDGGMGPRRATAAQELLAQCVAAAQAGAFYRCFTRWGDDPELRDLAKTFAGDEAVAFARFRCAYEHRSRIERFGFTKAWRAALRFVHTSRDTHVPLAFRAVSAQCSSQMPFPVMRHGQFVRRMRAVIERNGNLSTAERLLFNAWTKRARIARVAEKQHRTPEWFKPMFKAPA